MGFATTGAAVDFRAAPAANAARAAAPEPEKTRLEINGIELTLIKHYGAKVRRDWESRRQGNIRH
jgi:hypothetical protein